MSQKTIPGIYRFLFTILDPILASFGVILHLEPARLSLINYVAHPVLPPAPETVLLLDGLAGFFVMALVLEVFLLRARPDDVPVWKILQAALACTDVGMLAGIFQALAVSGRLGISDWRFSEFSNISLLVLIGAVRVAFCLGVGMPKSHRTR